MNKRKGAEMKDEEIIELYAARDEKAITETDIKYGAYCKSIAQGILENMSDTEECVNDTYLRVWNKIPPTRPKVFKAFLAKIVRELSFDRYRLIKASKRGGGVITGVLDELEECIPSPCLVEEEIMQAELADIVRIFVRSLPEKEAMIFLSRYFYVEDIESIAKRFGMTKSNISTTLCRLRRKLQKRLVKEGYMAS